MICKFGFGGMMEMIYIAKDIPLWQVTIWDKKFNNVDKKWQPKTIKYKYLLSDELDSLRVDDGDVRILYTGKDVGFTTEELAGDRLSEGEIISIPWGGIPTVKYHKGKFVTGDNRIATSKDINKLTNKYLYYFMRGNIHEIASYYRGASLKHPCMKDILKMTISYPSVQEQDKICGQFDVLEQIIEVRKQELQLLDDLIKARFVEMFGNPDLNEKEWDINKMERLCEVSSSKRIYQNEQSVIGIPFLRISDLVNRMDTGSKECDLYIPEEKYEELKDQGLVPIKGDILLTARGTLGRCYIIQENDEFYFQDGMITWLSNFNEKITSLYIAYLFSMPGFRKQIDALQAGSTVAYLSISMTKKLDIMVPPIELQNQFADFVHQVDKSKVVEIIN